MSKHKSKKLDVVGLRALRKASHLSNRVVRKSSHFLDKVERKTSKIIINKTGSPDGGDSVSIDEALFAAFPQITPVHPALPQIGQRPSVTVFTALDPRGVYGGILTLLIMGAALANRLGYDLRVAQTTGFSTKTDVLKALATNGIVIPKERFSTIDLSRRTPGDYAYLPLHKDDVVIVSAWWDAQVASQLPLSKKFVYMIQDFEPIFYNNSDSYVMADQTYRNNNFIPVCNTQILYDYFAANGYDYIKKNASWFEPAPAPKVAVETVSKSKTHKLFLYGRTYVHRNLYYTALQAMDKAFQDERLAGQKWEFYAAGQSDIPSIKLHSGQVVKNLGKMDLEDYYKFMQSMDVAISMMMAPHPNYPTLEMPALGAMVVTCKYETKQDLSRYSPNILMADTTLASITENIIKAALTSRETRHKNMKANHLNTEWPSAIKKAINEIAKKLS